MSVELFVSTFHIGGCDSIWPLNPVEKKNSAKNFQKRKMKDTTIKRWERRQRLGGKIEKIQLPKSTRK